MEAIGLQPSRGGAPLPAVRGPRTIPRHAGRVHRTRVARLRPAGDAGAARASRERPPDGVLRLRSDGTLAAARQPDAADAAAASPTGRPPADRVDGRRHWAHRRPERQARRTAAPLERADPREPPPPARPDGDRKSTRLNSSHLVISYAVFCLKKKKKKKEDSQHTS